MLWNSLRTSVVITDQGCLTSGLFDMALKNLGFLGFFKNLKSPNLGFLENKKLTSDLSF